MSTLSIELVQVGLVALIALYFWSAGLKNGVRSERGWKCVLAGFLCILAGQVLALTGYWPTGTGLDTAVASKIANVIGLSCGLVFFTIGLHWWIPRVAEGDRLRVELERKVYERTAGLNRAIELLESEAAEHRKARETIGFHAQYDSLTKLPNRRLLGELFESLRALAMRNDARISVCFVDLDNFKTINDTAGHEAGDRALQVIASRLRKPLRRSDVVARLGGDEFVILLYDVADSAILSRILTKLTEHAREPLYADDAVFHVGLSIGVAIYPTHGNSLGQLLAKADQAMYETKVSNKGGFLVSSQPIEKAS